MQYAQVESGLVTDLAPTAADDTWHSCGDVVESGWTFNGNTFSPPYVAPVIDSPTAEQILQQAAQVQLTKSDITVVRCVSAGVTVPTAWQTYRNALRAIVNGTDTTSTTLPTTPTYPAGT